MRVTRTFSLYKTQWVYPTICPLLRFRITNTIALFFVLLSPVCRFFHPLFYTSHVCKANLGIFASYRLYSNYIFWPVACVPNSVKFTIEPINWKPNQICSKFHAWWEPFRHIWPLMGKNSPSSISRSKPFFI